MYRDPKLTYRVAAAFRGEPEGSEKGVRGTAIEINNTAVAPPAPISALSQMGKVCCHEQV